MTTHFFAKTLLIPFLLVTLLSLNFLTGCQKDQEFYAGPIPGWEDVAIPEDALLIQSSNESPVENHSFTITPMTRGELFAFLEEAMVVNGWEPNASSETRRQFIKEGDLVTYNCNADEGTAEKPISFLVIIEPSGVYDNNEK